MFERLSAFTRGRWASVARVALAAAGLAAFSPHLAAEGTRTLHPAAGDGSTGNRGVMDVSNTVNANVVRTRQFLYVYAEAGEVILLGSRNRSDGGDIFVYNPQSFGAKGNETIPGTADFTCSSQSGRGTIASRAEELAGPNSADLSATVTNGFNPCWYAAPSTGIYGVRFTAATCSNADGCNNNTAAIATPTILNADRVAAWDVTVRGSQNSLADLNGRVFTYAWTVYLQSNSRFLRNALYYVSSDGFRYKQTFRNLDPNRATFYANSRGFVDAGAPLYRDIRGANQNVNSGNYVTAGITAQAPEYPIFFSDVMPGGANATEVNRVLTALAIPHAPSQPMLVNPSFNGNVGGNTSTVSAGGVFTFDTQNTLTYEIVISGAPGCIPNDFNPANVCNRVLTGTALTGSHTVLWDGLDNNGNPFPAGTYDFRIYGRNGEIHFPMLDVEGNNQGGPTLDKLNGFQPADRYTVYYDDRGYRTNNNTLVGVLNGHLCGAASLIVPPSPDHSLVGANSNDANFGGSGNYYRVWGGSNDANTDCSTTGGANQYFATAKGLDLWALERSVPEVLPIVIIPLTTGVDVGTQVSVTSNVLPGDTAYGNFVFTNAGDVTATGVTYGVTIGNPLNPVTCPAAVNFTLLPPGVTATWNPAPLCTVTFAGMPTTLAPGQSLIFNFNYVVVPSNPGPIPVTTTIGAGNETCTGVGCAPNTANAQTVVARPVISVVKNSSPVPGTLVDIGDTITYTLSATIANAPLTAVLTLTDTLGPGLTYGGVSSSHPSFTCTGSLTCTLPIGTAIGTYTVTYTATVNNTAVGSVANNVTATGGGGDNPPTCTTCTTTHPLTPAVTVSKASNPASGVAVSAGQTITYTVTAVVSNAALTSPLVLTDTLSGNQTFGSVTNPGSFSCTGTVQCTLPTGTAPGTYTVEYTATVNANATGTVGNNVVPTGGTPGGPTCTAPGACETSHPLNPAVTVSKASNPASGTAVVAGQTITYTVTVVVANATTNEVLTLADTLSGNQTFGTVDTGSTHPAFTCGGSLTCTLPAGTAPGTYTLVYTATVNTNATGPVGNNVAATNPPGGDPDPVCTTPGGCQTTHPLNPAVTVSKASNPASGTAVSAGQTITYTLTAVVSNAALTSPLVLTDTLSANQTFGTVTNPGSFSCTGTVQCTLPTGTAPGTYTVEYTATVNANATGTVGNNVVPTGGTPGGPSCSAPGACETSHPLKPSVTLNKSANPASGSIVALGETITYTVNVVVANAALLSNVVVTDVLDPGLTFGSVTSSTGFTGCTGALTCTLPTGTAPGTYTLIYTATVAATATTSVNNSVTATGGNDPGDPGNPQPVCTTPGGCQTSHPLAANVTLVKAGPVESGGTRPGIAEPGETLTWTITLSNSGGVAFTDYDFTENVPNGATLTSVTGAGVTACATPVVGAGTCAVTVASVPASGSTTVTIVFTVANPIPAGVTSIVNLVNGGDTPPDCPSPNVCSTTTPTEGRVAIAKTVADANGNGIAEPGETLTWTITLTNDGGSAVSGYGLTDPLDANTTFVSATNGGSHAAGVVTWTGLTVPPQVGATPGTLVLTVVTTVNTPIPDGVRFIANLVHETGGTPPDCSATPTPANCASIPTAANVTVAKSLSGESITADGIAEPGEQLTYTITLRNHGGTVASNVIVNETVPLHTTFVSGTPGWSCAAGSPAGTACDSVVNVPAADAGGSPGVTTLTFTVQVVDPLPAGVTQIANAVTIDDGTPPNCAVNPTHPACVITPTINLNLVKSVESVTATGPGTYWVAYRIDLANTGGSPVTYTLTDTPDFTPMGVTVTGNGLAATTSGTLNPALPGGAFAVANGTAVQISAAGVTLAAGATHSYTVRIPIAVSAGSLGNAVCTGAPGNGLYNRASVTGSFARDSSTCAPVSGEQPLIRLVKSVRLGVDANGDHYGNVGDVLHYTFAISNPGTVTLSAIDLIDPRVTDLQCDATTAYGEPMRVLRGDELFIGVFEELLGGSLVPGDSITCSATYTITAQDVLNRRVVNSATTHGAGTDGQVVMSTSTAIYTNIR